MPDADLAERLDNCARALTQRSRPERFRASTLVQSTAAFERLCCQLLRLARDLRALAKCFSTGNASRHRTRPKQESHAKFDRSQGDTTFRRPLPRLACKREVF